MYDISDGLAVLIRVLYHKAPLPSLVHHKSYHSLMLHFNSL